MTCTFSVATSFFNRYLCPSPHGWHCIQVVPIKDKEVLGKIHQTYRIGYIKDVILPRVLDDATFATLASLMLFNNVEVLMALQVPLGSFP